MLTFKRKMDSFKKYKSFNEFIIQPINNIIEEYEDSHNFRDHLKIHSNYVKQEIVTNCRAHTSIEDRVEYLKNIRTKLQDLHITFFTLNSKNSKEDLSNRKNKLKKILINDVVNILVDLKNFVSHIGSVPQRINFVGKEKQKDYSFKLINEIHKKDIFEVCNKLKQLHNLTINPNTSEEQFYQCFSGKQVVAKVTWLRNNVMHYFITELAYAHLMKSPTNRIWEIAANCFVDKDGNSFTAIELGKITPLKNEYIKESVNAIIKSLRANRNSSKKTR
jgi:hypothetical protein